jgi:hypothetical protein
MAQGDRISDLEDVTVVYTRESVEKPSDACNLGAWKRVILATGGERNGGIHFV